MRFETYGVGAQLVRELEIAGAVSEILHDGRDIIHVHLVSGESLMIHLIDSYIPLYEIKNILARNTQSGHHTLFILWSDMLLPDHGTRLEREDWHKALLAISGGKIYAYKVYMQRVYIFPIYFDMLPYLGEHVARYGDPIDVGSIRCSVIETQFEELSGRWRVADFGGDPDAYHRQRAEDMGQPLPGALREYYLLLGVEPGADLITIKRAYRRLARQYHPDLNVDQEATERMQEINRAYRVILKTLEDD